MKYEAPELIATTNATTAIQGVPILGKPRGGVQENSYVNEPLPAYQDWE